MYMLIKAYKGGIILFTVGIITASDKGAKGERTDSSGKLIEEIVIAHGYTVKQYVVVPDDRDILAEKMKEFADQDKLSLILTTGGTGFSKRDVTPEATLDVIERQAYGISEAIRANSMKITPKGMLSRGIAGIRGDSLIINLPGSPKAVKESLEYIMSPVKHGLEILLGLDSECAEPIK